MDSNDLIGEMCADLRRRRLSDLGYPAPVDPSLGEVTRVIWARMNGKSYFEIAQHAETNAGGLMKLVDQFQDLRIGETIMERHRDDCEMVYEWVREDRRNSGSFAYGLYSETEVIAGVKLAMGHFEDLNLLFAQLPEWASDNGSTKARVANKEELREKYVANIRLAATHAFPLSGKAFDSLIKSGYVPGPGKQTMHKFFGSWAKACQAAGVESGTVPERVYDQKWTDSEILDLVILCWTDLGRFPSVNQYVTWLETNDGPSPATLRTRFGSWTDVRILASKKNDGRNG